MMLNSLAATPAGAPVSPAIVPLQRTLAQACTQQGVGLHSGAPCTVQIHPAPADAGRYFIRVDLPGQPRIPATLASVHQTVLSTELAVGEAKVRTVEHLLAALAGLGVDNARIEIDGPEVPLLDGSALPWVEAIAAAGLVTQTVPRPLRSLATPVTVQHQEAFVTALPAPTLRFTYGIDFDHPAIGNQWHSWPSEADPDPATLSTASFAIAVAPARTFGLAEQIEYLRAQGLIQGGSLANALVCDRTGWVNPPLRFSNEPARHKLLDLVGDLSLLGSLPACHVLAYKASHQLHVQLARSLQLAWQDLETSPAVPPTPA